MEFYAGPGPETNALWSSMEDQEDNAIWMAGG